MAVELLWVLEDALFIGCCAALGYVLRSIQD